jgi:hypothetical protein
MMRRSSKRKMFSFAHHVEIRLVGGYNSHRSEDVQDDNQEWGPAMLSRGEVATIRAEIERLEKALKECTDGGIRDRINAWIEEEKKKLTASGRR